MTRIQFLDLSSFNRVDCAKPQVFGCVNTNGQVVDIFIKTTTTSEVACSAAPKPFTVKMTDRAQTLTLDYSCLMLKWTWADGLHKSGSLFSLPWPLSAALGYPHRKGGTEYGIRGVGACEVLVCQKLMCFTWKRRSGIVSGEGWTVADGNIGGLLWLSSLHESMHAWSRGCAWSLGTCRMQEQVRGHAGDRESWRRRFGQRQRR